MALSGDHVGIGVQAGRAVRVHMPVDFAKNLSAVQRKPGLLLRMDPRIESRHEAENGGSRVASLRVSILVGLLVYNTYNITSIVLLPDIFWFSVMARVLGVTLLASALIALLGRLAARWRERSVLTAMIGANLLPVWLFWLSDSP